MPNGNLHKRFALPQKVVTHLFVGEVSGNSFGGMHSEAVKSIGGDIRLKDGWPAGQLARRQAGLSYWANVEVRINGTWYGPGMSSFFPWPQAAPRWTKDNIIMWIEQAMTNPADKDRSSRDAWTQSPRAIRKTDTGGMLQGIRINKIPCKVLYQDGVIASIYPKVPD